MVLPDSIPGRLVAHVQPDLRNSILRAVAFGGKFRRAGNSSNGKSKSYYAIPRQPIKMNKMEFLLSASVFARITTINSFGA